MSYSLFPPLLKCRSPHFCPNVDDSCFDLEFSKFGQKVFYSFSGFLIFNECLVGNRTSTAPEFI